MSTLTPHPPATERRSDAHPKATLPVRPVVLVAVTLAAVVLTALLDCAELVRLAQRLPYGTERTVALHLADANRDVARALALDRPRRGLDRLFGHEQHTAPALPSFPVAPQRPPGPSTGRTGPTAPTRPPTGPATTQPPPPSAAHPLRVYLGGDSVADQVGAAFGQLAGGNRALRVTDDARISTGLTRPDYFDWPGRLHDVLAGRRPPQVVVVMFGANDVQPIMTPGGPASVGTSAWLTEYRRRVAGTMGMLAAIGADVYWVGQPLMRSSYFSGRIGELDTIYATEAAKHPGIRFVDTRPLLADAHGRYADYLPGAHGLPVRVRAPDGVHLTLAGAERVADHLLAVIGQHHALGSR